MKKTKKRRAAALICAWLICLLSALTVFGAIGASAITNEEANTETGWGDLVPIGETTGTTPAKKAGNMETLIKAIFSSFSTVIKSLAGGIKDAFSTLLYTDPAAGNPTFSPLVLFLFTMAGVGLAAGILYRIFGLIKSHRQG